MKFKNVRGRVSLSDFTTYRERKLERLRLGQATCEIVDLPDDDRLALVPLTEGEYSNSLHEADKIMAGDNPAGAALRDETQRQWIIFHSARVVGDLESKWFQNIADVVEMDSAEINHIYDVYLEMVAESSPALVGLSEADFNSLKTLLPRIEWSELSGPQWYAAQRFLNSIQSLLLTVSFSGLSSTKNSTQMSNES